MNETICTIWIWWCCKLDVVYNQNLDDSEHTCKLIQKWMLCIILICKHSEAWYFLYCKTWATQLIVLATVAFLLPLHTNLLSQAGITHYSQLLPFTCAQIALKTMLLIIQIAHYSMCSFKLCPSNQKVFSKPMKELGLVSIRYTLFFVDRHVVAVYSNCKCADFKIFPKPTD